MYKKKLKYALFAIVAVVVIPTIILALMPNLQHKIFSRAIYMYSLHNSTSVKFLIKQGNYVEASNKIMQYIEFQKKLSSSRGQMFEDIVNITDFSAKNVNSKEELMIFKPIFEKLIEIDPNLYGIQVWLSKSISGSNYQSALKGLDRAIELSPVYEMAYRVAVEITQNHGDKNLAKDYCKKYMNAQLGGVFYASELSTLDLGAQVRKGIGLRNIVARFNNEERVYPHSGIELSTANKYKFYLDKPINLDDISLNLSIVPGVQIIIKEIKLYKVDRNMIIDAKDLLVTSDSAYEINNNGKERILLYLGDNENKITHIQFPNTVRGVQKVVIDMSFHRMPLPSCT
jgi:hypothetical protein